ncbi:MAG: sugar nucleotide-binding protein, partial [Actinobacteria bacterium]
MKVLITGAGGALGHDLITAFSGHDVVTAPHAKLDIADRDAVLQAVGATRPDAIVHAGA